MKRIDSAIDGLCLLVPRVFADERGFFFESWNRRTLAELGVQAEFVQDNHAGSGKGTIRGLHYQTLNPQDKRVRALTGSSWDVCVDLRRGSKSFGRSACFLLSAENRHQLWVPKGFAHGYQVLSDRAEVAYKVTDYWTRDSERGLRWNDPALELHWHELGVPPILNARDEQWPRLHEIDPKDLP